MQVPIYLESGSKRTFAGAIDWPGWCRGGRDESSAIEALVACGPRYAHALQAVQIDIALPADPSELVLIERLQGSATTDFGAPDAALSSDEAPISDAELRRFEAVLKACWLAFAAAAEAAGEAELHKGPRGGGRDLPGIIRHVVDANGAYLQKLSWKPTLIAGDTPEARLFEVLDEVMTALVAAAAGEGPMSGPRGGKMWTPRYFVRRVAWHMLDHAWEIEDRTP